MPSFPSAPLHKGRDFLQQAREMAPGAAADLHANLSYLLWADAQRKPLNGRRPVRPAQVAA